MVDVGHELGALAYGPLDDWRSHSPDFSGDTFRRNLDVVARLNAFAGQRGIPLQPLAVAWAISSPAVNVSWGRPWPPGR